MIGSWVMLIYRELSGIRYALRTLDVDFAVHIGHTQSQLRADLKQLITGLGFTDYLAAEGVQKFTGGGYEVEFIGQRFGKETRRHIAASCDAIGFPLHRIGLS